MPRTASPIGKDIGDDFSTFVPPPTLVRTLTDQEIVLAKISWKKERLIMSEIRDLLSVIARSGLLEGKSPGTEAMSDILTFVFDKAPEKMTRAAAILLHGAEVFAGQTYEQLEAWVDENLDSKEIVNLLVPFLQNRFNVLGAVVQRHIAALTEAAKKPTLN